MKVVLAHEWILSASGSDKVAAEIARCFDPVHDEVIVVTAAADPAIAAALFPTCEVRTLWTDRLPGVDRHWKRYAPALLVAWSTARMPKADLLVSSSHFAAKAAGAHFDGRHINYCHTPMRYAWRPDLEGDRLTGMAARVGGLLRPSLRQWDRWSATSVDTFVANSHSIAERIGDAYERSSVVVHPPVDIARFIDIEHAEEPSQLLCFGRLVGYKRIDLAVRVCTQASLPLVVAGDGPELGRLRALAGPTVRFETAVSDARYRALLAHSTALIFPGEEDFGIVPVEAMAAGVPVVAFGRGGALDTVTDGVTGIVFAEQSTRSLADALGRLAVTPFERHKLAAHAANFGVDRFHHEMR